MISWIVSALRPVYQPLLKLRMEPPHLPEGSSTVQQLRPSTAYLSYLYLLTALGWIGPLAGAAVVATLITAASHTWGVLGAIALMLAILFSLGFSFVVVRLDWELRHYLIGTRSLRVRQGAMIQQEVTLSFANIQNVEVTQGPLERLFGFKNVKVTTAGGTASHAKEQPGAISHGVLLVGLTQAESIRDLLLNTLRKHRDSGLGDPDDTSHPPSSLLEEVRDAARELREAAERRQKGG